MNKKGVTLIELIVVMVIIAIGAALMVPGIGRWLPNYRLRSATRDIVSTMRTAQMRAISANMTYHVLFTPTVNPTSYVLQYQTTAGVWVNEGATQNLPSGISISAITFGGNSAQFNSNSTSTAGSLTLASQRGANTIGTKRITVTASTGRCTIQN
jgi:prepilin-type N-terminal cleavage/methylation domain-containing protein